ncbi:methyl-accepting chemotaxis protein [Thalassobacillus pellis]|uniref:methyl-accepting chemotaxis protein n=1 Tax=Thalassobacillus pellis TaxID=748008 RepID=UPI0019602531|nr:HAMP domain-containing methyl-accepting chemotaxis protein [Thalassobacillus pellis]MBM7553572.1 methyl-accepting chemotaxis protein [Thalassobacillus pellis]
MDKSLVMDAATGKLMDNIKFPGLRSLRTKVIAAIVLSLLISSPISAYINAYVKQMYEGSYGVYINTGVTLLVTTSLISVFIHLLVIRPLNNVVQATRKASEGDLTFTLEVKSNDEIGQMAGAFNTMLENLSVLINKANHTITQVVSSSDELKAGAKQNSKSIDQISVSAQEVVSGTESQSQSVTQLRDAVGGISKEMGLSSESIQSVSQVSDQALNNAEQGSETVKETVKQMNLIQTAVDNTSEEIHTLEEKSVKIDEITEAITQIAEQTNLLSLNAAIEAARAGEHGKGFAVVADEIRKLAEKSADAAGNIQELIKEIQNDTSKAVTAMKNGTSVVEKGIMMVDQTGDTFENIVIDIRRISSQLADVAKIARRVDDNTKNMNDMTNNIAAITEQTAGSTQQVAAAVEEQTASMEEIASSSVSLNTLAQNLQEDINEFKIQSAS